MRFALVVLLSVVLVGCFVSDDGDDVYVENGCDFAVLVDVQESAADLEESKRTTRIGADAREYAGTSTPDPSSLFIEARRETNEEETFVFEVAADDVLTPAPGELVVVLSGSRCP